MGKTYLVDGIKAGIFPRTPNDPMVKVFPLPDEPKKTYYLEDWEKAKGYTQPPAVRRGQELFVDHSGTLWIGCDLYLYRYDPVSETFTHFRIGRKDTNENDGPVMNITEDRSGNLWLATFKGLFMLNPANGKTIRFTHDAKDPLSISGNDLTFCDEDRQGTFWVASCL
jgi:ligand-binding sensor domain-containing protein